MSIARLMEEAPPDWLRHPAAVWPVGTLDREALYAEVDRLAEAPGFVDLARTTAREMLGFVVASPMALRVVRDMPMYLLLVCCMYLHHRRNPDDPCSGITLTSLRELYSRGGTRSYAADTHLRDMLAWARLRGLLQPVAAVADRRLRPLEPGPPLIGMFQGWVRAFERAGVVRLPSSCVEDGLPLPQLVFALMSHRISAYAREGFVPTERYPLIQQFMQRRHGYHVFLGLVDGLREDEAQAELSLSVSGLATRLEVARGTIRNTLQLATDSGLIQHDNQRGPMRLTPAFMRLARRWMAMEVTWMNGMCRAASHPLARDAAAAAWAAAQPRSHITEAVATSSSNKASDTLPDTE